tara:strand:- start:1865 stop:2161 length:297 start_codon:yes stop_codon:yes gene_type:complete
MKKYQYLFFFLSGCATSINNLYSSDDLRPIPDPAPRSYTAPSPIEFSGNLAVLLSEQKRQNLSPEEAKALYDSTADLRNSGRDFTSKDIIRGSYHQTD